MAIFAMASRFASRDSRNNSIMSPAKFAERARAIPCTDPNSLCIDDIKASLLLCIHEMTETGHWEAVAEVSKLARMAEIYHGSFIDAPPVTAERRSDIEEWKSVWWTIYSLDSFCSAMT